MKITIALLVLIYALIVLIVCLKIGHNSAYFLTPDSHYYLQATQNMLDGKGYSIQFENRETFCAIWPIGYPLLIAITSKITSLSLETASKIVNLLALAGCFWLLFNRFREKSWWIVLPFLASSLLQLYANTWSETVFLFFVFGFILLPNSQGFFAIVAFLMRYTAVFLLIPLLYYRKWRATTVFLVFIVSYLVFNYWKTQTFTGGHGFWPNEPFLARLERGFVGVIQEILFFAVRDWDLKNPHLTLWWQAGIYGLSALQAGVAVFVFWQLSIYFKKKPTVPLFSPQRTETSVFWRVSLAYFLFTLVIYLSDSSIENLYFRRLAPSSLLFSLGAMAWISEREALYQTLKWPIIVFFLSSVAHAVPKIW